MTTDPTITARFDSDLDMVKRAQQGDADAFAALFHQHKARIYSVCLRMTNNTAEAEDLTQDAFLQVFRKLATFRGDSALSTWLYRIAVNTVLMHFRKKALRQISLDEPYNQDAKTVRREYGSRDDRLTGSVDRIALARAIKELPDGYRTIFPVPLAMASTWDPMLVERASRTQSICALNNRRRYRPQKRRWRGNLEDGGHLQRRWHLQRCPGQHLRRQLRAPADHRQGHA